MDDSLKVPDLFCADQLGEQVCYCVALLGYIVHFKAFKNFNESFGNVVALEQHCFLGLVSVGNLPWTSCEFV